MTATKVLPKHIRNYMDMRGKASETQANREHSFMSKVFSWGYERGKVSLNPCLKVRKFTETARDRYITDEEYSAVFESSSPMLRAMMEVSFCCAARQGDVLALTHKQLGPEGIFIKQGKTGKAQIKGWTKRLRAAIDLGKASGLRNVTYVFSNTKGARVSANSLRNWYTEAKAKAAKNYPDLSFDFTFHDIKAKSISDYEKGEKQEFSGHKTRAQMEVYNRKTPIVDSHD
jgi:integrase